ncbi:MAG: response regulator [Syntrophorhabdaceae bacterium]|nr:response regulator [Syntrophorhabdaceae bacterium]
MSDNLNLIIIDDDPDICELLLSIIKRFYVWGDVISFSNTKDALTFCKKMEAGVAIFVIDVFIKNETAFEFLDKIAAKFPMCYEDTVIITGNASDDVVNMCIASDINYLIEKPIKPYTLQLTIRAIVGKYIKFAKRLLSNPVLAESIAGL